MSQHPDDADRTEPTDPGTGISDDQLPEDLRPTEDNPLAQPLEGEDAKPLEELDMQGGKVPEQRDGDEDTGDARDPGEDADESRA